MADVIVADFERQTDFQKVGFGAEDVASYERAMNAKKLSFSQLLEQINPTPSQGERSYDGTDAFQRQLKRFNLRTQSDPLRGIPASSLSEFWKPEMPVTRDTANTFTSGDPQSWILFPEFINRQMRVTPLAQDVLGELVAKVTPIDSAGYKTIYMNDTQEQRRLKHTGERAELPTVYIQTSEHNVYVKKYGLRIVTSYEYMRRVKLDIFSLFLQRIAAQNKLDQATMGMDIILNGDGNGNAAPNWNMSTMNASAPAGPGIVYDTYLVLYGYANQSSSITKTFDYQTWLRFKATLWPMQMSTIVGRLYELLQILTLQFPNINPLLLLAQFDQKGANIGTIELAQGIWGSVRLVYMPFMPGGLIVGMDRSLLLEQLIEVNSNITESARNIIDQTNMITVSQNIGFNKIINESGITLTYA